MQQYEGNIPALTTGKTYFLRSIYNELNYDKQMKSSTLITILSTFLLVGCSKQQSALDKRLDEVERIIEVNPDSASILLENIPSPEKLDDKTFARWCMLSGKVTDEIFNTLLPSYQFERANAWYSSYGKPEEQVQTLIYLGRSHANDGDYDKAMSIYTNALEIGNKNKLYNLVGYTYSYMGDLYREKAMRTEAIEKYEMAADNFKKENNTDSYACALRDIGREYACIDSIPRALEILFMANSIAETSEDKDVKASIENTLGNIYVMQDKYDKAKKFFYKALEGREKMPNYIALVGLYIASDSLKQAKELLQRIPQDNLDYTYSIKNLYYQIYKSEGNYKEALTNLEEYTEIVDSLMYADSQSKILDIETKYNNLKIKKEVIDLKNKEQSYIIVLIICTSALLFTIMGYLLFRKRAKEKIQNQQAELSNIKTDLYNHKLKLEKKRIILNNLKEKDENYDQLQEDIIRLSANYRKLQNKLLVDSPLYKELTKLGNQNIPGNDKSLITEERWKAITNEITTIYPELYNYIYSLGPNLPEEDFQYCCLYLLGFDTNTEAKLLNIATNSVSRKRSRLKQKLNITLPTNFSLYEYLIKNMH